jgi:hypothetical protein
MVNRIKQRSENEVCKAEVSTVGTEDGELILNSYFMLCCDVTVDGIVSEINKYSCVVAEGEGSVRICGAQETVKC